MTGFLSVAVISLNISVDLRGEQYLFKMSSLVRRSAVVSLLSSGPLNWRKKGEININVAEIGRLFCLSGVENVVGMNNSSVL